jgi:ABC-type sugar transport system ATPase subunit
MRLELVDVHKSFGDNHVLRGVSFTVGPGEIVALVGENGAGKSTLTRVISGAHQPDAGQVRVDGEAVMLKDPQAAMARGIEVIYQEFQQNLFPHLSVAENMHVLDRKNGFGRLLVAKRRMAEAAETALKNLGMDIAVGRPVGHLSVAERQMVEIAKAMTHAPALLILDEPTAALDEQESERLFTQVRRLSAAGVKHHATDQVVLTVRDAHLAGKSVPADETLQGKLVTKENAKEYATYLVGIGDSADVPASLR